LLFYFTSDHEEMRMRFKTNHPKYPNHPNLFG
jgi:hypothetical protein